MSRASSTSCVRRWLAMAQPTTRRLQASTTTLRYKNPNRWAVGVGSDRSALFVSQRVGFCRPPSEPDVRLSPHPAFPEFVPMSGGSCRFACPRCGDAGSPIAVPVYRHPLRAKQLDLAITDLPTREKTSNQRTPVQSDMPLAEPTVDTPPQVVVEVAKGPRRETPCRKYAHHPCTRRLTARSRSASFRCLFLRVSERTFAITDRKAFLDG